MQGLYVHSKIPTQNTSRSRVYVLAGIRKQDFSFVMPEDCEELRLWSLLITVSRPF